jgi:hypothetical protein
MRVNAWTNQELDLLRSAYAAQSANQIGLDELALRIGRHKTNVCRKARQLGLTNASRPKLDAANLKPPRRAKFASAIERSEHMSQVAKARIARDGHPRPALGLKHTEETKALIGLQSKAFWSRMTEAERDELIFKRVQAKRAAGIPFANPRGTWKAAWREIGGQRCFFRSRWEANYARYLELLRANGQIESWEHEAQTFWFDGIKRGCVSYLPDFKVTLPNGSIEWHEVKGWMDARSKTTLARMARYHPKEKLVLVQAREYAEIQGKVGRLIAGWEV